MVVSVSITVIMMNPNIEYPYMPTGRHIKYVPHDHVFMQAAAQAREECAGDPSYPVGAVLVKDGEVVARAGNGFNRGKQVHVCPRIVLECPTGTGYDLCDLHLSEGHSEPSLMKVALEEGIDPTGCDVYMYGHWWACEPCWQALIDSGVRDLYVTEDAHDRFSRDKVYSQTMSTSLKSAYIAGPITNVENFSEQAAFYVALGDTCEAMGITARIPHRDNSMNETLSGGDPSQVYAWATGECENNDVTVAEVSVPSLGTGGELVEAHHCGKPIILMSKKGSKVSRFVLGNPAVVYHFEYDSQEDACRKLKNVLKQL
ncbi:MAG: hypothetical protein HQ488_00915 [Parcubacteria group bacterium]|nr:hypothetical protein [Parcubacteria group bacterium]